MRGTASLTQSSSSAVMRRWLGMLPHICHPTPSQAQAHPPQPSGCGDSRGTSACFGRGEKGRQGRPRQGRDAVQQSRTFTDSQTQVWTFFPMTYCFEFPSTATNTSHNSTKSSHHAQHTCNSHRQAGRAAYCISFLLHPSVADGAGKF